GLVMTYGFAVVTGAGLYAVITGIGPMLNLPPELFGDLGIAKIVVVINSLLYLLSALLIATRIPALPLRNVHEATPDPTPAAAEQDRVRCPLRPQHPAGARRALRHGVRFGRTWWWDRRVPTLLGESRGWRRHVRAVVRVGVRRMGQCEACRSKTGAEDDVRPH